MAHSFFAKKPLEMLLEELKGEHRLRRVLGPVQLTALGVGAIIGAGIFVSTGAVARNTAGPALMLSYVVAGMVCAFAGLCYAEFASMVPMAGSAYTYAYATLGELMAWIIGWDLILEYAVGAATVATGWSSYAQSVLGVFGIHLPHALSGPVIVYDHTIGKVVSTGSIINLPAVLVVGAITVILVVGIRESARFNGVMVAVKLAAVLFVIGVGVFFINPDNWHPFAPYGLTGMSFFGKPMLGQTDAGGHPIGMLAGAAIAFFAYIGFDAVSTQAEEAKRPSRDVPIGILASLGICTVLYIAVVAVLTGMVPYDQIAVGDPVADAFGKVGLPWAKLLIAAAGVAGITSVLLVMMMSQPRVFLAMSRDGLLPRGFFAAIHERFRTPWKATILTGACVGLLAAFLPIDVLLELVNMGTLMAFAIVCGAVLVMRRTHPNAERPFRVPFVPLVPILGILSCLTLMMALPPLNWIRLVVWLAIGLLIYFTYGRHRSVMAMRLRHEITQHGVSGAGAAVDE